ncbi:MAG: sigma-70 family RNA polymerase sigma factor [Defluviitaleaceae bacterium]|nr:sigma-70 family RNA polymerase sigma factor [Defluviitaleaceae bacterium]MCL2273606.1 sigma-70 family RNA polymerase sigma factor [Defluviitaleaceae bacterium]
MLDDDKIIDLYFSRMEIAIAETRKKYGGRLFTVARNILFNKEDAEECVNDTLMKAWQHIPPKRPEMLGAYLSKIVRNLSINALQAKKAAKRGGDEVNLLLGELTECIASPHTPENTHEANEVTNALNMFLAKQEKTARVAFVLRYFHGESINNICTRFNMGESKVKSILFRTRKKLRTHLEKEGIAI